MIMNAEVPRFRRRSFFMSGRNRRLIGLIVAALFVVTASGKERVSYHLCTQMPVSDRGTIQMAHPLASLWKPGTVLRVYLMGGTKTVRSKVQDVALQWNQFSSVKLQFVEDGQAEIRVSFVPDNTSWSYVGTDCLNVSKDKPTMNFGWLKDTTPDKEISSVVLHEFGHALGCIHEHQSPAAGIPWNKPKVYDYYWREFGWPKAMVDKNVFATYNKEQTQFSHFDTKSIMLYAIPAELTTDGSSVGWNNELSTTDKQFIGKAYPVK